MARPKRKKNSGTPRAMPASKKLKMVKKTNASKLKASTRTSDNATKKLGNLGSQIDSLLNEVSNKLDKGPVSEEVSAKRTGKKTQKETSRRNLPTNQSRANSMKTNQSSGNRGKGKLSQMAVNDSYKNAGPAKSKRSSAPTNNGNKTTNINKPSNSRPKTKETNYESDDEVEYDEEEEDESENESNEESEWEESKPKTINTKSKPNKGKRKTANKKATISKKEKATKKAVIEEEEEESDDQDILDEDSDAESDSDFMSDDNDYSPKKGTRQRKPKQLKRASQGKKLKGGKATHLKVPVKKEKIPPVAEMVIDSIKALGANPRNGSTLRSIKETILLNWPINIKMYNNKIKNSIVNGIEKGNIIRVKGIGFKGRFTVPGLKMKKKKRTKKLGKKFDEDEEEYAPQRTRRDDDREESKNTIEREREDRKILEKEQLQEKASRPKKKVVKKEEWEVEAIKGIKDKDDERCYLVKWKGYTKLNWEPEENVQDCDNLIDEYLDATKRKEEEQAKWKRLADKGTFEPARILDVKTSKGQRQFLIRWKGLGTKDDRWELENNLKCTLMIEKFMFNHEKELQRTNGTRNMREAPKRSDRFVFASSKRVAKRKGGLGISYAGMDED